MGMESDEERLSSDELLESAGDSRPAFSIREAETFLQRFYGRSGKLRGLPSYSDQNFRVDCRDAQYVLKIANADEPYEVLDFQQKAILHVRAEAPTLRLPAVIPALDGAYLHRVPAKKHKEDGGVHHLVWMVSYLPGQFVSDLPTHPPTLLESLGVFLGSLDRVLASFEHPAMHRDLNWDLKQVGRLHNLLDHIKESEKKHLVLQFLERLDGQKAGRLSSLRQSVIHNDANDNNVLIAGAPDALRIGGIIDFGDMVYSYTIGELAIAIAYMILGKPDPLDTALHVLRGYHQIYPLIPEEIEVLFDLVCLRLCTSVCMSARERSLAPDNAYLAVSEQPAWEMLGRLANINPETASATFLHAT